MNDDLPARLHEDDPEAGALLPALRQLRHGPAPTASAADTARLLAVLQPALAAQTRASAHARRRAALVWPWLVLVSQLRVVQREVWLGSVLVVALGTLVALASAGGPAAAPALPLVLTAPVVAAVGVAYLFGGEPDGSLELVLATPVHPRLLLLARLALLFAFDLALCVPASLALSLVHVDVLLWPLVQTWLAPMACLSAAAFLFSVLLADPNAAALLSLGLWCLQVLRQTGAMKDYLWFFRLVPDLLQPGAQGGLWLAAAALVGLALWLGGQEERWLRRAA